jgi:hypothetical protein
MGLMQWWVGAIVLGLGVVVAAGALLWPHRPRRTDGRSLPAAALDRVRRLPAFQALARRELRYRAVEAACLAVMLLGAALLGSRLVGVGDDSQDLRSRDVILCLDVSGSMRGIDTTVIDTYLGLVGELQGERIGFMMFDANAVVAFPLTGDYDYVRQQLLAARTEIGSSEPIAGTTATRVGSSLIGDGLASCVQHFDHAELRRSRTVVLATDNLLSGDSIYTLDQAMELARQSQVMVYGIMPQALDAGPMAELRQGARTTNGDVLAVTAGEPTNTVAISSAIQSQQKAALILERQDRSFDNLWPGTLLFVVGLLGLGIPEWGRPR